MGLKIRERNSRKWWTAGVIRGALVIGALTCGVSGAAAVGVHLNSANVPGGCSACHKGHGVRASKMLRFNRDDVCFECHGAVKTGAPGEAQTDMFSEFGKISHHPVVETSQYHGNGETLPERQPAAQRHVACYDCHNIHTVTAAAPFAKVTGYSRARVEMSEAQYEYQVCYKCHSDSINLPVDQTDKILEFDPTNPSFHPVEAAGANPSVPSLVTGLTTNSIIKCTSCHGNSNTAGPQGPHGSDEQHLLKARYDTNDGVEGTTVYALCYGCHDRRSIVVDDDSFKRHSRHVVTEQTSCFTCHESHGSRQNPHLINFNDAVVAPSPTWGGPDYIPDMSGGGQPRCYLTCHGVVHEVDNINGQPWPPGW